MSETAIRSKSAASRVAPGRSCHSVESTTSRSDADQLLELRRIPRRLPRQRQKAGRSEMSSGSTIARRRRDAPPRRRSSTDLGAQRSSAPGARSSTRDVTSMPSCLRRAPGRAGSCATDAAPRGRRARAPRPRPLPAAPTRCASSRSCASRRAVGLASRSAQLRELRARCPATTRASRINAAARSGRRGGAARRPPAAPTCRPRSSGSRAVALPGGDDRVDERPLLLHLVRAREERRVTEHASRISRSYASGMPVRNAPP